MTKIPLSPLGERIVATREETATKTATGLYLPESAKEKSQVAKVVAVGKDAREVKVGDRIIIGGYQITEAKIDGVEYMIVKEEDVLAVVA
ncbi:MAG TPA: co-chaperone GroES [Candidatus Nanoperiomorbaceae bacterium]|nr:co-chaperone GroES [Candidatus Nanoperiomorbaceae bacterium]HMR86017.1 co-chaperone GroES [Candidatus Nanoperiomorbaceae bacterium]HMU12301.1 co-chaperone GroES [Candidatus Nanoperiomorbaceae bacterium]